MRSHKHRKKMSRRKKVMWIVSSIALALLLIGGGYFLHIYMNVQETVNEMHKPLDRDTSLEQKEQLENVLKNKEAINFLLLGVDERTNDDGRSDTMIFASLNPDTESVLMFSIPRDTYVTIPGREGKDKINHAYAFGGVDLSVATVENYLDVPIHFYSKVNMEGFSDGVEAVGGVTVQNDFYFEYDGYQFNEGEIELNGDQALSYSRMRYDDPRGDFGRTERQRKVIQAALDKMVSFNSVGKITNVLDVVGDNVQTNLDMSQMRNLLSNYAGARKSIESLEFNGNGQRINNIWYLVVPDEELNRIQGEIESHSQTGTETENASGDQNSE